MITDFFYAKWAVIAPALANHLWQSTLFAAVAAILTLALRKNSARVRYRLWLAASLKFLVPFSLLMTLGGHLAKLNSPANMHSDLYLLAEEFSQPVTQTSPPVLVPVTHASSVPGKHAVSNTYLLPLLEEAFVIVWLCGFVTMLSLWGLRWRSVYSTKRSASPVPEGREVDALRRMEKIAGVRTPIAALSAEHLLEPGIFGIVRPALLWPAGISRHLTDAHLEAIIAHEVWHVRRRDNLAAAIHMTIQAMFWFHPLIWWLGARLVEERERACDEEVVQLGSSAKVYAEGILKTCEFCVPSPLPCISGVTGADLRNRIVRIMTAGVAHRLTVQQKLLLFVAGTLAVVAPISIGRIHASESHAGPQGQQSATGSQAGTLADTWQGTLHAGQDLRIVVKISKADNSGYKAVFYSIDQGGDGIPADSVTLDGTAVKMAVKRIAGTYEGKLSSDGKAINGTWSQGPTPLPLTLARATPETEWTIPPPAPRLPPMAENADPSFEVATIKPSAPNQPGKGFGFRGDRFNTRNTNLNDLLMFAYRLHVKQIIDAPPWFGTDLYDIEGKPDVPGRPNPTQTGIMVQKLLADRCKLTFHHEKRELSVYVITVGGGGPKMEKSTASPTDPSAFFFRGLGDLTVRNQAMGDFASWMQTVLDRPVVDQTGITGKYDFQLKWTPDDSQFAVFRGTGALPPPPKDDPNPPPALYTAIQEQIGLKMGPAKVPVDVIVIDHVEKPSAN
jgi:uncharacterized protein (TIGR03435 family)